MLGFVTDRSLPSRVGRRMRWSFGLILAGALAACGGGGGGKAKSTTPAAPKKPLPGIDTPGPTAKNTPAPTPEPPPEGPTPAPPPEPAPPPPQPQANPSQRISAAEAAMRAGQYATAEQEARAALAIDETSVAAMAILAKTYYMQGKTERADFVLDRAKDAAAKVAPDNATQARLAKLRGLVDLKLVPPKKDEAIAAFQRATELDDGDATTWHDLGTLLVDKKDFVGAIPALEKATKINPRFTRALVSLGAAYRGASLAKVGEEGKAERDQLLLKAKAQFDEALKVDPALSIAHYNLGILYLDADSFPGVDTLQRLAVAAQHLSQYQQLEGARLPKDSPVAGYIEEAKKATEKENKRIEREKKKAEKAAAKAKKDAEKAAKAGKPAPAPEPPPGGNK